MLTLRDSASFDDDPWVVGNGWLPNHVITPGGRFESFDFNGQRQEIDWDEIDPLADDDESEPWRQRFAVEVRAIIQEIRRRRNREFAASIAISNDLLRHRTVSACGRYERFLLNGAWIEVDWNEIAPPDRNLDEEGIPHEQVMEEAQRYCEELERQP